MGYITNLLSLFDSHYVVLNMPGVVATRVGFFDRHWLLVNIIRIGDVMAHNRPLHVRL